MIKKKGNELNAIFFVLFWSSHLYCNSFFLPEANKRINFDKNIVFKSEIKTLCFYYQIEREKGLKESRSF